MIKNRIDLAYYFEANGFTRGAEIGVADGRYSEVLLKSNPNLTLYAIDPWKSYGGNWRSDEYQEKAFEKAKERLKGLNVKFMRMTSLEASLKFDDNSLDFVFIDGAHDFDNVMLDIILWSRKVKKGGIVSGHDYYVFNGGVIPAVNAYIEAHKIDLRLTLPDAAEHKDDQCPCWYFEKK